MQTQKKWKVNEPLRGKGRTIRKVMGGGGGEKNKKKIHGRENAKEKKIMQKRR